MQVISRYEVQLVLLYIYVNKLGGMKKQSHLLPLEEETEPPSITTF